MGKHDPRRGEIWKVRFDRTCGQEIRRVVVMNIPKTGRVEMRIVVPITTGHERFENLFWMTRIRADSANGLEHDSFADVSQIQSVSLKRFIERTGVVESQESLDKISAAIAFSVGYSHKKRKRKRK